MQYDQRAYGKADNRSSSEINIQWDERYVEEWSERAKRGLYWIGFPTQVQCEILLQVNGADVIFRWIPQYKTATQTNGFYPSEWVWKFYPHDYNKTEWKRVKNKMK